MRPICFFTVLIGTLALVPSMSAADVSFQAFIQGDLSYSDGESQEPMSGFEADFLHAGGSMNTDHVPDWAIGLRLGLEPSWQLQSGWRIGVVTWYNVAGYSFSSETGEQDFFSTERIVSETSLDWWDDVTAVDLVLKRDTPAVGVSVAKNGLKCVVAVQQYDLVRRDYAGDDVFGGTNDSHVKSETDIDDGFGQIIQLWYDPTDNFDASDRVGAEYGVFYERYGSDAWFAGVSIRVNFNWFFECMGTFGDE